jgi:hypothetical protein
MLRILKWPIHGASTLPLHAPTRAPMRKLIEIRLAALAASPPLEFLHLGL